MTTEERVVFFITPRMKVAVDGCGVKWLKGRNGGSAFAQGYGLTALRLEDGV